MNLIKYLFIFCLFFNFNTTRGQIISTFAGIDTMGALGDGGPATAAFVGSMYQLCADRAGNIYIADPAAGRIRKVNRNGIICTIAGNGTASYSGDGGAATAAGFNAATGVAVDGSGNIFISDGASNRIRKIDSAGVINTIAGTDTFGFSGNGGPATAALLYAPWGLAVDGAGNLFFADAGNNRIRKISPAGIITTIAGTGTSGYSGDNGPATLAKFHQPTSVAVNLSGDVFIGDGDNGVIRKINTSGIVTTYAGNGSTIYSGDGGPATAAGFNTPLGIALDVAGNLYVADWFDFRVRKVDTAGIITTIAGNGALGSSGDGGPATAARLGQPSWVGLDASGNIYISDMWAGLIRIIGCSVPPIPPIDGVAAVCAGSTITLSDTDPGGIWRSGSSSMATIGAGTGIVSGISPGNLIISYSLSNSYCISTVFDTITVNPMANAGIITSNHANAFCIGDTFTVADTVPGGVWRVADTNLVTLNGTFARVIHAGYDTIFYTAGNACDTVSTSYPIFIDSLPPITGKLTVCPGDTTVLGDARGGGFWSGSFPVDVSTSVADSGIVAGLVTGVAVVTYHVDLGCSVFATITVLGAPVPGSISGHSPLCEGATTTLSETKGGGTWTSSNTSVAVIGSGGIVNTVSLGSATITYTVGPDTNGCINISRFYLTVISSPLYISSLVLPPTCYGGSDGSIIATTSGSNGPFVWAWSNGDSAYMANFLSMGSYSVLTMDKLTLCTAVDSFTMTQPDSLIVSAEVTNDNCHERKGSITVAASGGTPPYYYYWPNSTGASVSGLSAGMYTALIKDNNSCTKYLRATVEDTCNSIVVHDVITPNGDGVNDLWEIEGLADYPKNTVQVFDKWGTQLYEKSNYSNDWGGRGSNGELLPDGTYYYLVKLNAENTTGGPGVFKGAILIKR